MAPRTIEVSDEQRKTLERLVQDVQITGHVQAMKAGESAVSILTKDRPDKKLHHLYRVDEKAIDLAALLNQGQNPPPPPAPALPTQLGPFSTGTISFDGGVPVGGWSQITLYQDGSYNFSGHFHDSGAPSYNDELGWAIVSSTGVAYTFEHSGHMAGTFESGSRDDDWNISDRNDAIAAGWADLCNGYTWRWQAGVNFDTGALMNSILNALKVTGTVVGTVVAIVAAF